MKNNLINNATKINPGNVIAFQNPKGLSAAAESTAFYKLKKKKIIITFID